MVKASGRVEWIALKALVNRVYMLHSRIAMQRAWLALRTMPIEQAAADSSPQVSVARWNAPGRQPGAGLLGLPPGHPCALSAPSEGSRRSVK